MTLFSMFLTSPPAASSVATVYREKRAFGPSTSNEPGFSPALEIEIAESAPVECRTVRTCCAGWMRVVGVQAGSSASDPDAPLVLALKPLPVAPRLRELGQEHLFEPPLSFIYTGLDPTSLRTNLMPVINQAQYFHPSGAVLTPDQLWQGVRGGRPIKLQTTGFVLAEVSAANLSNGHRTFSFAARTNWMQVPDTTTPPLNFLDPVVLFQRLVNKEWILASEAANSLLEVVTKNRVLITIRDEWNSPLTDSNINVLVTDGTTQDSVPLTSDRAGTLVGPTGMGSYLVSVPERRLTKIASFFNRAEENAAEFSTEKPAHHVLSSVRPEDWFRGPDPDLTDATKALPLFTEKNAVEALVDGFEAFRWMVSDLRKIRSATHFFLFTSWWINHTFELIPGQPTSTLQSLLENINEMGAPIRSLIWHFPWGTRAPDSEFGINRAAHNFISGLRFAKSLFDSRTHHTFIVFPLEILEPAEEPEDIVGPMGVAAYLDVRGVRDRAFHMGCHHAKTYIIRGTEGTVAYIGGMDINKDRLDGPRHLPTDTRFHDVHARIVGPAGKDLAKAFVFRWNDHPENRTTSRALRMASPSACPPGETCIDPVTVPEPGRRATCMVQIARTSGAKTQDYALRGDRNIWSTLKQALDRAKKYVYFEEQYLVSPELSDALFNAISHIEHLVVVMDHWGESKPVLRSDFEAGRHRFFKPLRDKLGPDKFEDKVHVFTLVKDGSPYKVHSKVVIIDDIFATIGSANMNRRGFTHDTEANAFMLDTSVVGGVRKFARDLRVRLWAEHLGWIPGGDTSKLWNIDKAIDILIHRRPPTARLQPYDHSRGKDGTKAPRWDNIIDPNGSGPPEPPQP
jgi:phosphatidylserine/phosphatidylglycerophosphate/cardiolipin synthase-like enzyme